MVKRTTTLLSMLAMSGLLAGCVDVGSAPAGPESCADFEPGARRCHDGDKLQTCLQEGQVWHTVVTCDAGQACFDAPLYAAPGCMPLFDCYDTAVHYITCDYSGLQSLAEDDCHAACKNQAMNESYAPLINCYGTSCKNSVEPYACLLDSCSSQIASCLAAPTPAFDECDPSDCETDPYLMVGPEPGCMSIASCYGECPEECASECGNLAMDTDQDVDQGVTCTAACMVTCQQGCRATGSDAARQTFFEWGLCQARHCIDVSEEDRDTCMWTHCTADTARCLASAAAGVASCEDTFTCMMESVQDEDGFDGVMTCIADGTVEGAEHSLRLLACTTRQVSPEGACASADEVETCVMEQCSEQVAACYP